MRVLNRCDMGGAEVQKKGFRPPAVPLVTIDPYVSVWSVSDLLYAAETRHWTREVQGMVGYASIDGEVFRFLGKDGTDSERAPDDSRTLRQIGVEVRPTTSVYAFAGSGITLRVMFASPLLLDDLDLLSRPISYVTFQGEATDGKPHHVRIYLDVTGEWCTHSRQQAVIWSREMLRPGWEAVRMGAERQRVLVRQGDNVRIDWGQVYLAASQECAHAYAIGSARMRKGFLQTGQLPPADDTDMPCMLDDDMKVLACTLDMGIAATGIAETYLVIGYDDVYSVEYFHIQLPGYWRREGRTFADAMGAAADEYRSVMERCLHFDEELLRAAETVGGRQYADITALAYRQAINAHKLVLGEDSKVLFLSKECSSNGCMATVDVSYPSVPLFLLYNPELVKGMMRPIFRYAASSAWPYDFAPHDAGRYPVANGQAYGMEMERQMPIEECANMLIMAAAVAIFEETPDFAAENWERLTKWVHYLAEHGLNPGEQLCTDDFAGHLAHNANLSIKAIVGIGSYGLLCGMLGQEEKRDAYLEMGRKMAAEWMRLADDGDHYRLAFNVPGSWSLKYNLVWDELLGLRLFPRTVRDTELAYYKKQANRYGTPLDSRATYTKADWLLWVAAMADHPDDFAAFCDPVWQFLQHTPTRVPFSDWYFTIEGQSVAFYNRSVVGAVFMKLLREQGVGSPFTRPRKLDPPAGDDPLEVL